MNPNNLPPDPAWDYSQVWSDLTEANTELTIIIQELLTREKATEEINANLIIRLDCLIQGLTEARSQIKPYHIASHF